MFAAHGRFRDWILRQHLLKLRTKRNSNEQYLAIVKPVDGPFVKSPKPGAADCSRAFWIDRIHQLIQIG